MEDSIYLLSAAFGLTYITYAMAGVVESTINFLINKMFDKEKAGA